MDIIIIIICFCYIFFKIFFKYKRIFFFKFGLLILFRILSNYNNEIFFSLRWMLEFLVIYFRIFFRY